MQLFLSPSFRRLIWVLSLAAVTSPARATDPALYETVHEKPQFSSSRDAFSFYWALWRDMKDFGPTGTRALLSQREIRWRTVDCLSSKVLSQDGEKYWFMDTGTVIQAPRAEHLYLVLANIQGIHMRGIGAFERPLRKANEDSQVFQERVNQAYDEWKARTSLQGARGVIWARTEARPYRVDPSAIASEFLRPGGPDFSKLEDPRHAPDHWPVYFDERAHKFHAAKSPSAWKSLERDGSPALPLEFAFVWSGCDPGKPVSGHVALAPGSMLPPGGPDRPGQTADAGSPAEIRFEPLPK